MGEPGIPQSSEFDHDRNIVCSATMSALQRKLSVTGASLPKLLSTTPHFGIPYASPVSSSTETSGLDWRKASTDAT